MVNLMDLVKKHNLVEQVFVNGVFVEGYINDCKGNEFEITSKMYSINSQSFIDGKLTTFDNNVYTWTSFKQDNKDLIKEFDITAEKFKEYIKSKIPSTYLLVSKRDKDKRKR
jgi:hypothetical protein